MGPMGDFDLDDLDTYSQFAPCEFCREMVPVETVHVCKSCGFAFCDAHVEEHTCVRITDAGFEEDLDDYRQELEELADGS